MSADMLRVAAQGGDINSFYSVLQQDPEVLERIDSIPFVDTPLHIAASAGHIQFATDIMIMKPSFALKLNLQVFTPIHLALQNGHKRIVTRLVDINKELVRVKGKDGLTPLHLASQSGEVELLKEFLKVCPDSIEDVNVKRETALHIAVSHRHYGALHVLVDWLMTNTKNGAIQLERTILNWKDEDGNTILHVAASNNDIEAISLLMKCQLLVLNAKNSAGQTALEKATNEDVKGKLISWAAKRNRIMRKIGSLIKSIHEWLSLKLNMREDITGEVRNAYLVAATLVATAIYQSALSPPGGLHQTDHPAATNNTLNAASNSSIYEAKSILSNRDFLTLSTMNMSAFLASTFAILFLLPRNVASFVLSLPLLILQVSYIYSVLLISPTPHASNVVYLVFVVLLFILEMLVPLFVLV